MVLRMPSGYDTRVGPGGTGLSGGQMQRVGLARALYKNPTFIVLDEPNSNLDDAGEIGLAKALMQIRNRKATSVIVTHRISALKVANKMLVMHDGKLSHFGPTQEVMAALKNRQENQSQLNAPSAV